MIKNLLNSIHTDFGKYIISFILGVGLASIFRKSCSNKNCLDFRGPHHLDIIKPTYGFNDGCYKFKEKAISCNTRTKQVLYA